MTTSTTVSRRAVLGAAGAAAGLPLLAACGSGTPGETAPDDDGGGAASGGDAVPIQMWQDQFSNEDNAWYASKIEAFNAAHDDIRVELVVVPGDAWEQKMIAAQAAGTAPDMYTLNYSEVQPKARNGELAPIEELIDAAGWDDLDARFRDAVTVGGSHFAYPMLYEPSSLLFYRTDLLEQAGLDPASPPTSWDDLVAAASALKASVDGVVPFQTAQTLVDLSWSTWGLQMNAAGHLPISDDWSTSLADDPAYRVLLETYQRLMTDGLLAPQALAGYGDITPFAQGQLAMQACGSWAISVLVADYADLVPHVAVAPLPSFDGDLRKPTGTLGGWSLGVDARSEHAAEAAAVISWLLAEDPSVPGDYFAATSQTKFSPRASVADTIAADADTSVNPWYDVLVDSVIDHQILEPTYDWSVSEAFGTALEKAQQGQDIAEAQATAHADITRAIEEKGLAGQNA